MSDHDDRTADHTTDQRPWDAQIRAHLADPPRPAPPIDPAQLAGPREAVSADGNVRATVDGQTRAVVAITITRIDDPRAGAAVVEAVNSALGAAEGPVSGAELEQAIADRVAALDRAMDRMLGRLESLDGRLDALNASLQVPQSGRNAPGSTR